MLCRQEEFHALGVETKSKSGDYMRLPKFNMIQKAGDSGESELYLIPLWHYEKVCTCARHCT